MKKEVEELRTYLQSLIDFTLPSYKELPSVDLYMEQVLKYVNDVLATLSLDQEKLLTSFMVNNYVKAKLIDLPIKKKYNKDQIGYLMAICLIKSSLSMADMKLLLDMDVEISKNKEELYAFWSKLQESMIKKVTIDVSSDIEESYKVTLNNDSLSIEEKENSLRNSMALMALRLSMMSSAYKLLADVILNSVREDSKCRALEEAKEDVKKPIKQNKKKKTSIKKGELNMKGREFDD